MKKEKKGKSEYSFLSNIGFLMRQLHKDHGWKVWLAFGALVVAFLVVYFGEILIPAVAVYAIEQQLGVKFFVLSIGGIVIVMGIIANIEQKARQYGTVYGTCTRAFSFYGMLIEKALTTDYQNVESYEKQKISGKALDAVNGNWIGIERVYKELPFVIMNAIGLIAYSGAILTVDVRILLVLVLTFICNIYANKFARDFVKRTREEDSETNRKFWYLSEKSQNITVGKDARIYRMEKWFGDLMQSYVDRGVEWQKRVEKHYYLPVVSDTFFIALRDGLAYIILIHMAIHGEITLATFTLMFGIVGEVANFLWGFVSSYNAIMDAGVTISDYRRMLDLKDEFKYEDGIEPDVTKFPPEIELRNVSFWYDNEEEKVLSKVNLHIRRGEKIALVGNNGAGKTTLVKLLCGFYQPKEGEILVNGVPIHNYNLESYFKMLGVVFQDMEEQAFSLLSLVSCKDEVEADTELFWKAVTEAGLYDKIHSLDKKELTHITPIFDDEGIRLSGGEMQKLMLARCIYKNAPFLILDEPTAALDPLAESAMYEEYRKMTKDKTSLFISHRLASTRFCDRIIFLENGRIIESGSHDELMKCGHRYAHIYEVQSHYYKEDAKEEDMEAAYEG